MMFNKIWIFFTKTVRRQLIWGVVVVHAVLMSLFIWDVTLRQQDLLLDQQASHASALVQSVSVSSGGWLLSRDVIGLQEIIDAQLRYPELLFAMAVDRKGLILAHTDRKRRGQFLLDLPSQMTPTFLHRTADLVDIMSPAIVGGQHVGWIRIGIGQHTAREQLFKVAQNGLIYALAAIIVGFILANIMGNRLTRRLYGIQAVANDIEKGVHSTSRAPEVGTDEAAQLARQFNRMLDTLANREQEIISYNQALHNSEARFQRSLRGSNDGLWEWDMKTNDVYFSPRYKEMLGYAEDELEPNFSTWERLVYPADIEPTKELIQQYVDGKVKSFKTEFRMRHKQGHWIHVLSRGVLERDREGKPQLLSGTHVDITERVNAENNLQQLAENINEVFWLGSPLWDKVFYINPAFEKIWGEKVEALYLKPELWLEAVHPDDRQQVVDDIPKNINSISEFVDFREYRIIKPGGEIAWIKARAYPIKSPDGQIIRVAGVAEDITNRVNMEETLRRTQKMDALGKLTGGIAHDYNNMLGVILGYSELLKERLVDRPDLEKYVNEIHHAGERGAKLTGKLLAFTRQQSTEAESLDVNVVLKEKQQLLEKTLTARIVLTLDLEKDLWPAWLDRGDLEDSIVNLSINAMHAIKDNGELIIQTRNIVLSNVHAQQLQLKAGNYVKLSFTDTGSGMDEVTKRKIFEPFFSTKADKGTGLGLSQVYGFVERCGGAINVDSELDNGTRMELYFPRCQQVASKDEEKKEVPDSESSGPANILLVDDELALLELNREILVQHGFNVFCAENAKQALGILENESIALLVSDVIMPNMNGYQLAAIVQEKYPDIKIQLISGYDDEENTKVVDKNLKSNILSKPFSSQELLQRLNKLLRTN